jgi:hypothetical protein
LAATVAAGGLQIHITISGNVRFSGIRVGAGRQTIEVQPYSIE